MTTDSYIDETEHITLCEALDRILNKGAVLFGEVTISVANVDLVYLALQIVLTSVETAREMMKAEVEKPAHLNVGIGAVTGADVSIPHD